MNKLRLIFVSLMTVAFAVNASAQTAAEVTAKFSEAAQMYNAKDYDGAIPLFEETISLAEESDADVEETLQNAQKFLITSYMNGGIADAKNKDYDQALDRFTKASELSELTGSLTKTRADAMIGNVYLAKGSSLAKDDPAAAADEFYKAYELNDRNTKAALYAAQSYSEAGNSEKAEEIYKEVIELGKTHSKYEEAAEQAKNAYTNTYLVAASTAAAEKDYAAVTANIEKITEVDPENAQALLLQVQAANTQGKVDDVIKYGDAAVAVQTDGVAKSNLNLMIGAAYQTKDNKTKAIEYLQKVTEGPGVENAKKALEGLTK
ncbi:MAG: hypothetical protein R3Y04_00645 [Rikenellaceae bacterium]